MSASASTTPRSVIVFVHSDFQCTIDTSFDSPFFADHSACVSFHLATLLAKVVQRDRDGLSQLSKPGGNTVFQLCRRYPARGDCDLFLARVSHGQSGQCISGVRKTNIDYGACQIKVEYGRTMTGWSEVGSFSGFPVFSFGSTSNKKLSRLGKHQILQKNCSNSL